MPTRYTVEDDRDVFLEEFHDHAGARAFRYGIRHHEEDREEADDAWPPIDYVANPYFCFQVYITFDLELDKKICRMLSWHLANLSDVQAKGPHWEIYLGSRAPLDCVRHSRHEIAHRKTLPRDSPRIYPLCHSDYDDKRLAFAFIIDNGHSWRTPLRGAFKIEKTIFPDDTGPLWVHFDRRLPETVTQVDPDWLVEDTSEEPALDQLDMEVLRIGGGEAECEISDMYWSSAIAMEKDARDGSTEKDENSTADDYEFVDTASLSSSNSSSFTVIKLGNGLGITNTTDQKADLQYQIRTTFAGDLEHIAQVFSASVARLTDKTFAFEVYSAASDTEALASYRPNPVGVLTDSFSEYPDLRMPETTISPTGIRRLHPLNYAMDMCDQDPITAADNFGICLILIDRPDFTAVPGVRFLLADGFPHEDRQWDKYLTMQSWRASNMEAVVNRLLMRASS